SVASEKNSVVALPHPTYGSGEEGYGQLTERLGLYLHCLVLGRTNDTDCHNGRNTCHKKDGQDQGLNYPITDYAVRDQQGNNTQEGKKKQFHTDAQDKNCHNDIKDVELYVPEPYTDADQCKSPDKCRQLKRGERSGCLNINAPEYVSANAEGKYSCVFYGETGFTRCLVWFCSGVCTLVPVTLNHQFTQKFLVFSMAQLSLSLLMRVQ
ncbi:hypothetical protein, partial [Pseudovibrio sp. W64]|uniref:hypothetical protein n=1 Tax=Pseudovibrio sp. W64 TaxID=1735583 RepID=UPI0019D3D66C